MSNTRRCMVFRMNTQIIATRRWFIGHQYCAQSHVCSCRNSKGTLTGRVGSKSEQILDSTTNQVKLGIWANVGSQVSRLSWPRGEPITSLPPLWVCVLMWDVLPRIHLLYIYASCFCGVLTTCDSIGSSRRECATEYFNCTGHNLNLN